MEFGDLNLTFKGLVYRSEVFNAAAGLGVDVPTAESHPRQRRWNGTAPHRQ